MIVRAFRAGRLPGRGPDGWHDDHLDALLAALDQHTIDGRRRGNANLALRWKRPQRVTFWVPGGSAPGYVIGDMPTILDLDTETEHD